MSNLQKFDFEITETYRVEAEDIDRAEEILEDLLDGMHVTGGRMTDRKVTVMKWS